MGFCTAALLTVWSCAQARMSHMDRGGIVIGDDQPDRAQA
jgi:hypothetical protein